MIELRELRKEFVGHTALDGIDLSVPSGEIHGIVGKSGAGKSTLIRCLTGLEKPTSGTVLIGDTDITKQSERGLRTARRNIGMVFQHANLLDSLTAEGNVAQPLKIAGADKATRTARARELLALVGLEGREGYHPAQLSGGQKQRVGIARALATNPSLLLCDEPTSALDSGTTHQILALIRRLRDTLGITVLIITHEMSVVREVCDSVTHLDNGRIAQTGKLEAILSDPTSELAKELIPLPQAAQVEDTDERATVEISLSNKSVTELFQLAEQAGTPLTSVTAGTLETIGGRQVGRLRVETANRAQAQELTRALAAAGYYVEGVA